LLTALSIAKTLAKEKLAKDSINLFVANSNKYDTFIDYELPAPSYLVPANQGYYIGWFINGSVSSSAARLRRAKSNGYMTSKAIEFKNDLAIKIVKVLKAELKSNIPSFKIINKYYTNNRYELSELNSADIQDTKIRASVNRSPSNDDLFDEIRAYAYQLKREGSLDHDLLADYAYNLDTKKSHSDIRMKVNNIFNWTERFYKVGMRRTSIMSRQEASVIARESRIESIKKRVNTYLTYLNTLQVLDNTDMEKVSISSLAKACSVSWRTARAYLNNYLAIKKLKGLKECCAPLIVQLKVIGIVEIEKLLKKVVLWLTEIEYVEYVELRNNNFRDVPI